MNAKHNTKNLKAVTARASLALTLVLCACSAKDEAKQATAELLQAQLVAEREMMTRILVNEMHGITGITDAPEDTIAYHGLYSYQSADNYEDRAFIPWDGRGGYVVFEVKPGLGPFRYYGIAVEEDGKARAMGASKIIPSEADTTKGGSK